MSTLYDVAPAIFQPLRQGEIVGPLWEHRTVYPPSAIRHASQVGVQSIPHALVIVLSPDCDLIWDHEIRFDCDPGGPPPDLDIEEHPRAVTHLLLAELFSRDELRRRFTNEPDVWKRVTKNQDERYHRFRASEVGEGSGFVLNDLFVDFKKAFSLPVDRVYEGVLSQMVHRVAVLQEVHVHDLIHRFYGFLSRIAVPE